MLEALSPAEVTKLRYYLQRAVVKARSIWTTELRQELDDISQLVRNVYMQVCRGNEETKCEEYSEAGRSRRSSRPGSDQVAGVAGTASTPLMEAKQRAASASTP